MAWDGCRGTVNVAVSHFLRSFQLPPPPELGAAVGQSTQFLGIHSSILSYGEFIGFSFKWSDKSGKLELLRLLARTLSDVLSSNG